MTTAQQLLDNVSLKDIPQVLPLLSLPEQEKLLAELEKLQELKTRKLAQTKFLAFVKEVWPTFIGGKHHAIMADAFERVAEGKLKRLIINLPPRHTKSEFASYLFPAWFLGRFPHKKIIQTSHTAELAVGFGRKVRNLVDQEAYKRVFPGVGLQADSKAAGRWNTNKNGDYFAIGVGGAVTGKGADCAHFSDVIYTKRGILPIADVQVGDYVKGYDHERKMFVWTPVHAISTQRKPTLVDVNGVLLTPEHRVFTESGYAPAEGICSVAVPDMRKGVSAKRKGACTDSAEEQDWEGADLLFARVRLSNQTQAGMHLREPESPQCCSLQGVLSEGQARNINLRHVQEKLSAAVQRVYKGAKAAFSIKVFLREGLFPEGQRSSHVGPSCVTSYSGCLSDVQRGGNRPAQEVLLDGVLRKAGGENDRVQRGVGESESSCEEAGSWDLRLLREREATDGYTSHRSRCNQQHDGERHNPVRTLPQPLSLSVRGACARGLESVLQGEGFWVVDIQTGTENFLVAPPGVQTQEEFGATCLLAHNCLIIDDPHSEQEAAMADTNPEVYDKTYEWYTSGPRQRLQPGGAIVIVQTRWSKRDLTGQVLKAEAQRGGEGWEVIELPAILPSGNPLWPEFWSLKELEALRNELPNSKWMAQYMQQPTSETSAIVKREWWQKWDKEDPPQCDFVLMAWDTAFEKTNRADYSACTTWGVFYRENPATGRTDANIILLNAFRDRMEFPELKRRAIEHYRDWEPDSVIIEKKASGAPLIYELRSMGIAVQEFTPSKGNDKISRLNAVSDLFASGRVWAPNTNWAEEVIDEVASFPNADHDDFTDSVSLAMMRFRKGGYIGTELDEEDEQKMFRRKFEGYY